jgi:RHS repeat-associated protein
LSGFQYFDTALQFFPTAEGYVNNTIIGPNNHFNYVFNYTDHLGNIRLSYGLDEEDNLKIIEENNYYPFGLKHNNYNVDRRRYEDTILGVELRPCINCPYNYKYNGKELQDELGLNWYDYQARNYDPALGRWMNIDPLAEKSRRFSPYTYALNNPVYFIDPDGMLSEAFINDILKKSDNNTTWTFNDDGTASGSNGATSITEESNSNQSENKSQDPPDSHFWTFFKSIFKMTPKSEEEAEQSNEDRELFFDATDYVIDVGEAFQTYMMVVFPIPYNPSSEIKATGWIARKLYSSLDPAIAKKFVGAISKGVVSTTGKQGIIKLTASEAGAVGGGYTYKLKILGKGGDLRIYGKQLPNGHFVFDKLLRH